jgi:HPt (histidine-containing phosphotransfer) domain-containing protein
MSATKTIDLTYLKSLSNGSDKFIKKMLLLFLEQTPEAVRNLEVHLKNKDWGALKITAHKLKASYMFLGIKEIPDIIASVEEYAAEQIHLDLLPDMIFKIKEVFSRVINELEREKKALAKTPAQ